MAARGGGKSKSGRPSAIGIGNGSVLVEGLFGDETTGVKATRAAVSIGDRVAVNGVAAEYVFIGLRCPVAVVCNGDRIIETGGIAR